MAFFIDPNAQRDLITVTVAHPNAEILRAIADGKTVQWRRACTPERAWIDYTSVSELTPINVAAHIEWRIKPEAKVYYVQLLKNDINRPVLGSMQGYDVDRLLQAMAGQLRHASPIFPQNGLLAFTHTDDGTITKIEYFTMKELRDKGRL